MGLDMYARRVGKGANLECLADPINPDFNKIPEGTDMQGDFAYWRKHANLHGWMEKLYSDKGGTEEFNCVAMRLTAEDLDRLEDDMKDGLGNVTGFFWGVSTDEDEAYTQEFIKRARQAITDGDAIFYDSWW